jgi:hypothetical protein
VQLSWSTRFGCSRVGWCFSKNDRCNASINSRTHLEASYGNHVRPNDSDVAHFLRRSPHFTLNEIRAFEIGWREVTSFGDVSEFAHQSWLCITRCTGRPDRPMRETVSVLELHNLTSRWQERMVISLIHFDMVAISMT